MPACASCFIRRRRRKPPAIHAAAPHTPGGRQSAPEELQSPPELWPPGSPAALAERNPDFVGWITIEGVIDYPVVRGSDNSYYLTVTFSGKYNSAGAILMDYRNALGFDEPVCIIYGHNMRNLSMFTPLSSYNDPEFMVKHPDIAITTPEGEARLYRVFDARRTDMWDRAYALDFSDGAEAAGEFRGAPDRASHFLILSTCTSSEDRSERMLVYASLVDQ